MDEQGEGDGAGPGAIAAELGNGDPNGDVVVERRAEQQQERRQQRSSKQDLAAATEKKSWGSSTAAVPSRHGRELFVRPCHELATVN